VYLAVTAAAVSVGTVLVALGFDYTVRQFMIVVFIHVPISVMVMVAVDLVALRAQYEPLGRYLGTADPGEASASAALVTVLNFPLGRALRTVTLHVVSFGAVMTALALAWNSWGDLGITAAQLGILWLAIVLLSVGHALIEYFATNRMLQPLATTLRVGADLQPAEEMLIIRVGTRQRMMFVSVFAVIVPLLFLAVTMLYKVDRVLQRAHVDGGRSMTLLRLWALLLVVGSVAAMTLLTRAMADEVNVSVARLLDGMRAIALQRFTIRLPRASTDEFDDLVVGFNLMAGGLEERERLHDAVARYMSPELADRITVDGVTLGGRVMRASVLFADIRDFTTLSEQLEPAAVVDLLNGYFAAVEPVVHEHGGWINKFGGDSLLAVFGVPVAVTDHASRALDAAIGLRRAVEAFNRTQTACGHPTVRVGVGVHSGELLAGNVGSPTRMEYTVIGDVVNVASRVEDMNKKLGTDILVTDAVLELCVGHYSTRAVSGVELKGKTGRFELHAVL
jgi:adenylate cyclase